LLGFCLQRNAFSLYILSLAGSNALLLFFMFIHSVLQHVNTLAVKKDYIHSLLTVVKFFSHTTHVSFLSAISTERCLSVLCPIWYHCHCPRHTFVVMCALLWTPTLLLNVLEVRYCALLLMEGNGYLCHVFDMVIVACLIFLFVILCGSSLILMVKVQCIFQQTQPARLNVVIMPTVLVFLLCGFPFGILWFLLHWERTYKADCKPYFERVWNLLSCVNTSANPVIYFFVGYFRQQCQYQQSLKLVLQSTLGEEPGTEENGGGLPLEAKV
uniref:G-protein coupled receptors family 1 profile domain-containing protein n=1 Tax=Loxodonta africana TaxID=9785 RepID=G3TX56_LOXAF